MDIRLTIEDAATADSQGSIVLLTGTDVETGDRVTFGGDVRPMADLIEALLADEEDEIVAEVEGWQIIRKVAP